MLKKILIGIVVVVAFCAGGLYYSLSQEPDMSVSNAQRNNPAPNLILTDMSGKKVELTSYKGKPLFLNFWATWCPPCVAEMPYINEIYPEYKDKINFALVSVEAPGDKTKVEKFIQDKGMTVPVFMGDNQAITSLYKVQGIPTTYIINAKGEMVTVHVGGMNKDMLKKLIDESLKKK